MGPESEDAGKQAGCEGCPNQRICASGEAKSDPEIPIIREKLKCIRKKILVLSGKGGVGKSTVSTNIAHALSNDDTSVGLLDLDITGPSLPKMLGVEGEQIHQSNSGWSPVYVTDTLSVMSIGFMLPSNEEAIIWRGPKKNGLIKQFLRDVDWGELEYLVIDTPPGTSDEHLSIVNYLKDDIDGAVLVTTPQEISLQDVRKEINFCKKVGIPIIGVVENMSGFVCPKCSKETAIFAPTTGGAIKMCQAMKIPYIGGIPIDPRIAKSCDLGNSMLDQFPDSIAAKAYHVIIEAIKSFAKLS